eukprot:985674-Rhodomonas_salina.1
MEIAFTDADAGLVEYARDPFTKGKWYFTLAPPVPPPPRPRSHTDWRCVEGGRGGGGAEAVRKPRGEKREEEQRRRRRRRMGERVGGRGEGVR